MVAKDRPKINISSHAIKEGLRVWLRNPKALYNYVTYGMQKCVESQIYDLALNIGWDTWQLAGSWYLIRKNNRLKSHIASKLENINYGQIIVPEMLYVIVRKLCPESVVETGVSAGVSSAYILQALHDNEFGKLYSIDYPNYAMNEGHEIPCNKKTGFAVPSWLTQRWELQIGMSRDLLPVLLQGLGDIEMFFHDSEHSYQNMIHEYKVAWDYLDYGGLLISHDIDQNNAFRDFQSYAKVKGYEIYFTNMGVIKK